MERIRQLLNEASCSHPELYPLLTTAFEELAEHVGEIERLKTRVEFLERLLRGDNK